MNLLDANLTEHSPRSHCHCFGGGGGGGGGNTPAPAPPAPAPLAINGPIGDARRQSDMALYGTQTPSLRDRPTVPNGVVSGGTGISAM